MSCLKLTLMMDYNSCLKYFSALNIGCYPNDESTKQLIEKFIDSFLRFVFLSIKLGVLQHIQKYFEELKLERLITSN